MLSGPGWCALGGRVRSQPGRTSSRPPGPELVADSDRFPTTRARLKRERQGRTGPDSILHADLVDLMATKALEAIT